MPSTALDGGLRVYETTDDLTTEATQRDALVSEGLYTSRHNPDFRTRNHDKITHIQTTLSNLSIQLRAASIKHDQRALDDLHSRMLIAGEDFEPLQQPKGNYREVRQPEGSEDDVQSWPGFTLRGGLWRVEHPPPKTEGQLHGEKCRARVAEAKRVGQESCVRQSKAVGALGFSENENEANPVDDGMEHAGNAYVISGTEARGGGRREDLELAEGLAAVDLEAGRSIRRVGC